MRGKTLNALGLGVAGGILWGLSMFVMKLICMATGYAQQFLQIMASVYPGYGISFGGSIGGLIYGFIDGFVGMFLLAWLYNRFVK